MGKTFVIFFKRSTTIHAGNSANLDPEMPFSHHSHSGQFCPGHARSSLEEIVQVAISNGLRVYGLTEHMPRHDVDQYPEERTMGVNLNSHIANEVAYFAEASRLRQKYEGQIGIPIGFECEWIRPESRDLIEKSIAAHPWDFFLGSVHHLHTIPIDYDRKMYEDARQRAGGTDERVFEDYFDAQLEMLHAIRPPIVAHFDLIRLKSDSPNSSFRKMANVWQKILRNLDYIAFYGGMVEINTAALRKGLDEPYPNGEICQAALEREIRFCLSDDSHGADQVAYGYQAALSFMAELGVKHIYYLEHVKDQTTSSDNRFRCMRICHTAMATLNWNDVGATLT